MQDKCVTGCEAASIGFGIDEPKPTVFLKTIRMCPTPQMEKTASKNITMFEMLKKREHCPLENLLD